MSSLSRRSSSSGSCFRAMTGQTWLIKDGWMPTSTWSRPRRNISTAISSEKTTSRFLCPTRSFSATNTPFLNSWSSFYTELSSTTTITSLSECTSYPRRSSISSALCWKLWRMKKQPNSTMHVYFSSIMMILTLSICISASQKHSESLKSSITRILCMRNWNYAIKSWFASYLRLRLSAPLSRGLERHIMSKDTLGLKISKCIISLLVGT